MRQKRVFLTIYNRGVVSFRSYDGNFYLNRMGMKGLWGFIGTPKDKKQIFQVALK
jgi:hypothetical protein